MRGAGEDGACVGKRCAAVEDMCVDAADRELGALVFRPAGAGDVPTAAKAARERFGAIAESESEEFRIVHGQPACNPLEEG